jgi:hypothetical protein
MNDIKAKFVSMFSELKQTTDLKIIDIDDNVVSEDSDVLSFMVRKIQRAGIEFPDDFTDIMDMNGIKVFWQYGDPVIIAGEFHLSSLNQALIYNDDKLWNDKMPAEKIDIIKDFRIFDDHPGAGDAKLAAFRLKDSGFTEIWYFDRGDIRKMNLDYRGYLEATADLKGIIDWQYLFCEPDYSASELSDIKTKLESHLNFLSTHFKDIDYTKYHQRLKMM